VLGLNQSGRPITLRFLSLVEHLDIILDARELCTDVYERNPNHKGMAALAGRFTSEDRIEYLDKA
jgi:ATP-dependent DNA helicase RecG